MTNETFACRICAGEFGRKIGSSRTVCGSCQIRKGKELLAREREVDFKQRDLARIMDQIVADELKMPWERLTSRRK